MADSFDPLHYVGRISPRRLLMISSREDRYFPAESAELLFERAGEPKRMVWTDSGHIRSSRKELVRETIAPALAAGTCVIADRFLGNQGIDDNFGSDWIAADSDGANTGAHRRSLSQECP